MSFPLFYQRPVTLSAHRHANWYIDDINDYGFARKANAVRLNMQEFVHAAVHYPIVFVIGKESSFPVALLGLRSAENLFVSPHGQWLGGYIPAYVRRYPYMLISPAGDEEPRLCVDGAYPGLNREDRGQPFFTGGRPSEYLESVVDFVRQYEQDRIGTETFCNQLRELDLLQPLDADILLANGEQLRVGPFHIIDRPQLDKLEDALVGQLVRSHAMDHIMAHLHSQRAFSQLINLALPD